MRRKAARFQADDVGDIDAREQLAAAGEIAGAEDLKIVRRGVAGEGEILPLLADDFMTDGAGQPVAAEAADREIVAVLDKARHRFLDRQELVHQCPRLLAEEVARMVCGWISKKRS